MADTNNTGSPTGEPLYLSVGFLRRPHGVHGEMIMDLHTDFPERLRQGRKLYVGDDYRLLTLESIRPHGKGVLIKFKALDTPEAAGQFRNQWVYVKAKGLPRLPDGQHYRHELIGMSVVEEMGNPLGTLTEIVETGANDVYVVKDAAGKEILLPNIPAVILDLDFERRIMRVHLLEGLT